MFKRLFSSNKVLTKCIAFYCKQYDVNSTGKLFESVIDYFKVNFNIEFKYLGFYDKKYNVTYNNFESAYIKLHKLKWDEVFNFSLDVEDLRKNKRTTSLEFSISRPNVLTVVFNEQITFEISDFARHVYDLFKMDYGFSYFSKDNHWASAYANGDREHGKSVTNIERLSKDDFQHWFNDCEKITDGYLRDIYTENILNTAHLSNMVSEQTLKEYIVSNKIGELSEINQELVCWKLDDSQLKESRNFLYKTNLFI